MSVIVKGMKMPKSCKECKIACEPYLSLDGLLAKFSMQDSVRSDCPLIGVPTPHGSLIDRDKLPIECIAFSKGKMYRAGTDFVFVKDILDAPTIIEEEGE